MKKIAFFDIDGTLTSEIDGSIPESAVYAIRAARANGNLMFINTGRCFQNVEQRFRDVGFDGFVCDCGTDIYCDGAEILHVAQTHETVMKLLLAAREWDIDILFESRKEVAFDLARPLRHPDARRQYEAFEERGYEMPSPYITAHPLSRKNPVCFILLHLKEICETTGMFRKGTLSGANRFEQKGRGL